VIGRRQRVLAWLAAAAVLGLCLAAGLVRPRLERALRSRIQAEAVRRGLVARVDTLRLGLWPPLRLEGLQLEKPGTWSLRAASVEARLRVGRGLRPGARVALGRVTLSAPAGVRVEAEPSLWDLVPAAGGVRAELRDPAQGLVVARSRTGPETRVVVEATRFPVARLLRFLRDGVAFFDGGTLTGAARLASGAGPVRFEAELAGRDVRGPGLAGGVDPGEDSLGQPTDLGLRLAGSWSAAEGALDITSWHASVEGASLSGALSVSDASGDPTLDLSLEVERVDFARLFRTSGLVEAPSAAAGPASASDLGSASLSARAQGRLSDPGSFVVTQQLDFTPPRHVPAALARLAGDFEHEVTLPGGGHRTLEVAASAPDFIALADVPPLFLRMLLLAEDAGFYGHPGIDLRELPSALITNWTRGGPARGASTITQQLAKNLFLSREKRLGRKLRELSLALLLESTLGKDRILEIYLNVIEWGPGLYGLRPAACAYFGREPRELTPAQMAFLVSLIPGPLKYQASFAHGTPVAGLRQLVDALLAKLRSVDALSEDEYQAALAEEIRVEPLEHAPPAGSGAAVD
jgi:Transglycosylase